MLNEALSKYNQAKRKMNLIFFNEAVSYICKITRILKTERGNALLIGLGGSGRNSLTNLSAFIRGLSLYSFEISKNYNEQSWKEDLRKLLKQTGAKNTPSYIFLTDNNILYESFLEDINNILNTGEVPNLMLTEDFEEIYNEMRIIVKEKGLLESPEVM